MVCQLGIVLLRDLPSGGIETRRAADAPFVRNEAGGGAKDSKSVFDAAPEIDRRGLCKYLVGQEISPIAEAEHDGLGNHLIIEDKVV